MIKIKISDFGLSKVVGFSRNATDCLGTLYFTAPEILFKQDYNSKVDIWSLGVILYFLMYERLPFGQKGMEFDTVVDSICYEDFKLPRYINRNLEDLLYKMLEKNCSKRISINGLLDMVN